MKLKYTTEELETMAYDDLAYMILKEKGKKMKTMDIFQIICKNLNISSSNYEDKIADFFTLLATEKRFIQLPKGYWDLKENYTCEIKMDDNNDDIEDDLDKDFKEPIEEEPEDYYDAKNPDDDEVDDGLGDLVVVDDIEEE